MGPAGFLGRAAGNALAYATRHVPAALVGAQGAWAPVLGIVLLGAAARGWYTQVREKAGVAEVFLPLYVALVLLWPQVWGGDRFVLPVLPLLLLYAASALHGWARRLGGGAHAVGGLAVLVVLVPHWAAFSVRARTPARAPPSWKGVAPSGVTERGWWSSWTPLRGWVRRFPKARR